ncbi:MAG TPA: beta-ketoacyl synthase chain length factor [Myxococcaceae bacterium]|nr:beta-ketoacyl synthase chain length factor [Myxococcaceae bacterium]
MSAQILGTGWVAPAPSLRVEGFPEESDPKLRRLPRLERMALAAARGALGAAGAGSSPSRGLVLGTGYGGLTATVDFLEALASRGFAFGSPTAFHQSVHHSSAGQISIALGLRGPSLTVSARELTGETALSAGLELLESGRAESVLVVAVDERIPVLDAGYRAFGVSEHFKLGEGAASVLLGKGAGGLQVERCTLTAHPSAALRFATPEQFAPLLRETLGGVADAARGISLAAPNAEVECAEVEAMEQANARVERWADTRRFGFHPSAGLLRLVASAEQLRTCPPGSACVLHGLAFGGGQSLTVLRHALS